MDEEKVNIDKLKKKRKIIDGNMDAVITNMDMIITENYRVAEIAHNSKQILDNLDKRFEEETKLNATDVKFLFFAVALQCIRQYVLTDFKERVDDQTAAKNTQGHIEEHSNRCHRLYHPSVDEIITNPVPFDAIYGSAKYELGIGGGYNHRAKTLGHDPLLGWVFGTMNILTSTITTNRFESFHVRTGVVNGGARDEIFKHANMPMILNYSFNRAINEGMKGKTAVAAALMKEAIHLKSDIGTTAGIPLPVVSTISIETSRKLANYGFDTANVLTVSRQAVLSIFINSLIAMLHRLYCSNSAPKILEVKTRKILLYSNVIASASNVIYVALGVTSGNVKVVQKLDIGGLMVTLYRLITDSKFIDEIKEEFIFGSFKKMIQGEDYKFIEIEEIV